MLDVSSAGVRVFGAALAAVSVAAASAAAQPTVQSWTFDTDAEGWSTFGDARDFAWTGAQGNPAGAIRATDIASGGIWFFDVPDSAAGNRGDLYNGSLAWDIIGLAGSQTGIGALADVVLRGNGQVIGLSVSAQPVSGQWTSWSADFNAAAGWRTSSTGGTLSGDPLDEAALRAVLGDLDSVFIRGEYTNGGDASAIDNVVLTAVPGPAGAATLGAAGLMLLRRRRG